MIKVLPWLFSGLFFIASLLATSGALLPDGLFFTHDTSHAARVAELGRALHDGHFPVRWSQNFGGGYGSPHFQFYAPLPYYMGASLWLLGVPMATTLKIMMALPSLVMWLGMFWLGWRLTKSWPVAIVAAVAVTVAPYRAVDVYVRGALSEIWGMMWLPWVLVGITGVFDRQRWAGPMLVIVATGLLLSHNLTALMAVLLVGVWVIAESCWWWWKQSSNPSQRWQSLGRRWLVLLLIGLLTLGVGAWYLGPVVAEQHLIRVNEITRGPFHYSQHFIYFRQLVMPLWGYGGSAPWPYNSQSNFLGYGQLLGLGVAVVAMGWFILRRKSSQVRLVILVSALMSFLAVTIFLTNVRSTFLWESVPGLMMLQFPWRWLTMMVVAVGTITALGATFLSTGWLRILYCLSLSWVILFANSEYFRPQRYLVDDNQYYAFDPTSIRRQWGSNLVEYTPRAVQNLDPITEVATSSAGAVSIMPVASKTHYQRVTITASAPAEVQLRIADFPGWAVTIDGQPSAHQAGPNGTMLITVPAGEHQVEAFFSTSPVRWWSDRISVVSWLLVLGWIGWAVEKLPAAPTPAATTTTRRAAGKT